VRHPGDWASQRESTASIAFFFEQCCNFGTSYRFESLRVQKRVPIADLDENYKTILLKMAVAFGNS
jgi:hypothetical protein